jgi:hypothetical protein
VYKRQGTNTEIEARQREIAGLTATSIRYRFASPNEQSIPPLRKEDIAFSNERCDWVITLTSLLEDEAEYTEIFDAFVASFELAD